MKVITTAQMQDMDRLAMSEFGVPGYTLMDRAGFGLAEAVDELADMAGFGDGAVRMVAGKGNNGGDVYVAARYLKAREYDVEVLLAGSRGRVTGDALKHLEDLKQTGVKVVDVPSPDEWDGLMEDARFHDGVVVDGVLGTGLRGPARGAAAGAIRYINAHRDRCPIVAVDIPSGLDSDSGIALGDTVIADLTVTMALPKLGLVQASALPYVGAVDVVDIGLEDELVDRYESSLSFVSAADCRRHLSPRKRSDHKGSFGHALLVGGAPGYAGAMILAARAALRSGAGLVSLLVPREIADVVAGAVPEAMVHAAESSDRGRFARHAIERWGRNLADFSSITVGPGMSVTEDTQQFLASLLKHAECPVVIDADGLNVLAMQPALRDLLRTEVVLTPHPGEMGRLMGMSSVEVQSDRRGLAETAAARWKATVVHKGAGTVIASPGLQTSINLTGNPGMARGGMGDVLSGLIGGLIAQGMSPNAAACVGTYLHGRAGDRVAWGSSQAGMTTSDLIDELSSTFAELSPR